MINVSDDGKTGAGVLTGTEGVAEARRAKIKVNGITIEVDGRIKIREMLVEARNAGAIEGLVEEYVIERIEAEGQLMLHETITVTELEEFVAVPSGPTDVAHYRQVL